jgi:predicted nucleic acid-binding protein
MIFADSSFFIGLVDTHDQWHKKAVKVLEKLKDDLVVSDLIVSESVTMTGYRAKGKAGITLYNYFKDNCHIEYVNENVLEEAMSIFLKFDGKLSVADSVSVTIMRRSNIKKIISFDSDFDRVDGIKRLQ